jgi:hypothetical protein
LSGDKNSNSVTNNEKEKDDENEFAGAGFFRSEIGELLFDHENSIQ